MRNDTKKKLGAIISAVVIALLLLSWLGIFLYGVLSDSMDEIAVVIILVIYAVLILAAVVGIFVALYQRIRELDSGEEEDARKY